MNAISSYKSVFSRILSRKLFENTLKSIVPGSLICFLVAIPSWWLGKIFPTVGGAIIALLIGMTIALVWSDKRSFALGINWTSKYVLQIAVVLLGFGMNLGIVMQIGYHSLPIIICTICTSLAVAWFMYKKINVKKNTAILIGVGSSICGGSAIAATAPVIKADTQEVAQSIAVIFLFNALAAILFPILGGILGFSTVDGYPFGVFAGTAINDTSSVTAAAATWDSMWNLGSQTLDNAVTVKLTRTLAIIPISFILAVYQLKYFQSSKANRKVLDEEKLFSFRRAFPMFLVYFLLAAVITTICAYFGISSSEFSPLKNLSKFCIMMAMAGIGLNSNVIQLFKTAGRPLLLGGCCWFCITTVDLLLQHAMNIW